VAATRARRLTRLRSLGLLTAVTLTLAACGSLGGKAAWGAGSEVREPGECTTVLAGRTPEAVAAGVSRALFGSAAVVVIASADDPAQVRSAAEKARRMSVPMLLDALTPGTAPPPASMTSPVDDRRCAGARVSGGATNRTVTRPDTASGRSWHCVTDPPIVATPQRASPYGGGSFGTGITGDHTPRFPGMRRGP
jgi:hypothetical protein